jgi:hypothetical protein
MDTARREAPRGHAGASEIPAAEHCMNSIGLCMIVKNEAHIIRRCIESVRPLVDYVLLVDTGSQDQTQDVVRAFLAESNLRGEVSSEPWRDFAWNRTFALERLRDKTGIGFALMIDADEVLVYDAGFDAARFKAGLRHDLYDIETRLGGSSYYRPQLFRNKPGFSYKAVLHEYLECPPGASRGTASGFHNAPVQDGARNRDPEKYRRDAESLEAALRTETDPFLVSRYRFYLAQSYRDAGNPGKALENYVLRAALGGWVEEVYVSLWQAARLKEQLGWADTEIVGAYLKAHEACPARAEALHGMVRYCRTTGCNAQGYLAAKFAVTIKRPETGLFVENWVYDYGMVDEFGVVAYWTGHYRECLEACLQLLREGKIPEAERARIRQNADFAFKKLQPAGAAGA